MVRLHPSDAQTASSYLGGDHHPASDFLTKITTKSDIDRPKHSADYRRAFLVVQIDFKGVGLI